MIIGFDIYIVLHFISKAYLPVSEVTLLERLNQKNVSLQIKHGEVKIIYLASQIKKHYMRTFYIIFILHEDLLIEN